MQPSQTGGVLVLSYEILSLAVSRRYKFHDQDRLYCLLCCCKQDRFIYTRTVNFIYRDCYSWVNGEVQLRD